MAKPDPAIIESLKSLTEFDDRTVTALAKHGTIVNVPARWSLMWENTPADKAYILLEGEVVIRKDNADIAELGPGAVLGEIALVNHKLRSASVFALTPIKALHFTDEAIARLVDENPGFGESLKAAAAARLKSD